MERGRGESLSILCICGGFSSLDLKDYHNLGGSYPYCPLYYIVDAKGLKPTYNNQVALAWAPSYKFDINHVPIHINLFMFLFI